MERMGGADALMLYLDRAEAYNHTIKLQIIDPTADPDGWSWKRFKAAWASRVGLVPRLRPRRASPAAWPWSEARSPLGSPLQETTGRSFAFSCWRLGGNVHSPRIALSNSLRKNWSFMPASMTSHGRNASRLRSRKM